MKVPLMVRFLQSLAKGSLELGDVAHIRHVKAHSQSGKHAICTANRGALWVATLIVLSLVTAAAAAQTVTGTLRGRITDPSGAVIPQATVLASTADGRSITVVTNNQGIYEFKGLAPGSYTVTAVAKGFAADQEEGVKVIAGQAQQLDIGLQIAVEQQHIEVQEESPTVGVSAEN